MKRLKKQIMEIIRNTKKEQWLVYVLLLSLLAVILIPSPSKKKKDIETKAVEQTDTVELSGQSQKEKLEQQLTELLQQVEGVGRVKVMITMESDGKKVVEKDTPGNYTKNQNQEDEGQENLQYTSSQEEETVYEKGSDGTQVPYVVTNLLPEIRGVAVIAQGGGNSVVIQQIQEAVMALFHIDANKIKVMKMK